MLLRSAGYEELREEQRRRRAEGSVVELGIGLGAYVEISNPVGEAEFGEVEITEDGGAILRTGSHSHGQGHETTFAMIAAERLGLPVERVVVHRGDTDDVPKGTGTFGSKSTQIGGVAGRLAADAVVERATALAADYLEASAADVRAGRRERQLPRRRRAASPRCRGPSWRRRRRPTGGSAS